MKCSLMSSCFVGAFAGALLGCAHAPPPPPQATPDTTTPAEPNATTTTTSAAAVPSGGSSNVNVSEDIRRACAIQFESAPSAPKFDFDKSDLRPDDDAVLAQIAKCLTTGPLRGRSVQLVGRADPRGEVEYNFVLGGHRAGSVALYLGSLGVEASRITETSRGKLDATGSDEAGWQMDRRVDVNLR
jgi:peptidoglycan-associated lipoprotein